MANTEKVTFICRKAHLLRLFYAKEATRNPIYSLNLRFFVVQNLFLLNQKDKVVNDLVLVFCIAGTARTN
jgi:hypothetical protein